MYGGVVFSQEMEISVTPKGGKKAAGGRRRSSAQITAAVSQSIVSVPPHSTTLPTTSPLSTPSPLLSAHTATTTTTTLPGTTPVVKVGCHSGVLLVCSVFVNSLGSSWCEASGRLHDSLHWPAQPLLRHSSPPSCPPAKRKHTYNQTSQTGPAWRDQLPSGQRESPLACEVGMIATTLYLTEQEAAIVCSVEVLPADTEGYGVTEAPGVRLALL